MSTNHNHQVTEENVNERIDKILVPLNPSATRSQIQKWIADHQVTVNQKHVKANYKCQLGDEIEWEIPAIKRIELKAENLPLMIIYEDDDLLVVNKPKGMVVHPTETHPNGTLVNALLYHTNQLSTVGGLERPGIVHRIDKDTSGLLVVAKRDNIHTALAKQLETQQMERIYEALVQGVIEHDNGLIDAPIGRNPHIRTQMAIVDHGKEAVTHFQVVKRYHNYTHVACQLTTGRTHQIRVHLKYIDHPIVGDPVYNGKQTLGVQTQVLFSKKLGFQHPHTKEYLTFEIEAPDDFKNVLKQIENMS